MKNWRDVLKALEDPHEPILNEYKFKGTKKKSLKYNRYNELVTEEEVFREAELEMATAIAIAEVLEDGVIERAIDAALEIPIAARRLMADVIENVFARIIIEEDTFSEIEEDSYADMEEMEFEDSSRQRSGSMVASLRAEVESSRSSDDSNISAPDHSPHLNINVVHQNFIGEGSGIL